MKPPIYLYDNDCWVPTQWPEPYPPWKAIVIGIALSPIILGMIILKSFYDFLDFVFDALAQPLCKLWRRLST